ncbi:MAG TPA: hypothetical protein VF174_15465 [Micromonosporaceae bacterium]
MSVTEVRGRRQVRRRPVRLRVVRTPATGAEVPPRIGVTEPVRPPVRRRSLTLVLAVVLLAGLVALGLTGHRWYQRHRLGTAHQAAIAAAKQATVDFVSISAASVDRDLQRISEGAAGDFADEFNRGRQQVRAAVVDNDVESRGTVLRAGLVSGDLDSAVVLVAVDATVKNVRAPEGRLSHYRIQVELIRDDDSDRWLVSRLQFVG